MIKKYIFSIITVVLLQSTFASPGYAQTIGFDITGGKNKISFPFESYNNLIVVPVILNHRMPLRFILDTGVRTSILTDRTFSDILNISYDRKIPLVGADGDRQIVAYVANGISLKLPGVVGQGQALLVLEEDYLQLKNYLGTEVHGILGYEIFSRFIVEIDYENHMLTLHEPYSYKPKRKRSVIPLEVQDTKPYIYTNFRLEDGTTIAAKLMLDTGASHSLLLDMESHSGLKLPKTVVRTNLGRGLGGDIDGYIGRIKNIEFGRFNFDDVIVSWPDKGSFAEILRKTGRQGTVGGGLMSRFTVVIDYFNGNLYYRKNQNFNNEFEYNMSGIDVKATGQKLNHYIVSRIREDSPATKVDMQIGDEIIAINSHLTADLSLGEVTTFFRLKEGRRLRLELLRGKQKIVRKIRLERVI
jgi:predicted aspartyl protease